MASDSSSPLVSIVITCYNYADYLSEAIESALNQTYQPIEIIVVDDGSTDNSAELAQRYPVTLICQTNQGVAAASNRGVTASSGKYYLLLNADDKLHPYFVEKTLPVLEENNQFAFAFTHVVLFGDRNAVVLAREYDPGILSRSNYIVATALVRRLAFDAVGGYDSSLLSCEDWDYWLMLAKEKFNGKLIPEPLFYYRQHGSSRSSAPKNVHRVAFRRVRQKHAWLFAKRVQAVDVFFVRLEQLISDIVCGFIKPLQKIMPDLYQVIRLKALTLLSPGAIVLADLDESQFQLLKQKTQC